MKLESFLWKIFSPRSKDSLLAKLTRAVKCHLQVQSASFAQHDDDEEGRGGVWPLTRSENSPSQNKVWSSLLGEQQMCFDQQSRKLAPDEKSNNVVLRGTCTSHLASLPSHFLDALASLDFTLVSKWVSESVGRVSDLNHRSL